MDQHRHGKTAVPRHRLRSGRPHIVGGMFGLAEPAKANRSALPFAGADMLFLANARSGIALLIDHLSPDKVWMPSYFCNHILKTLIGGGTDVGFYGVSHDLSLSSTEWISAVSPGDLVVVTDYFGFPCDPECMQRIAEQGGLILEDASQALLTCGVGRFADFVLFSPRKFLGVPDGGVLVFNRQLPLKGINLQSPPTDWWLKALGAAMLRREFDLYGGDRRWFDLFRESELEGPMGSFAMSELSRLLLISGFDYAEIAKKRVENYRQLASGLGNIAIFPELPDGVVPLGFPVRVRQRDRLRGILFSHGIYPPVHWPIQDVVPGAFSGSHRLSAEIMTIPCDQRYDKEDMKWISGIISSESDCF